jgi:TIR domain/Pentapeptide repeats (8 copies)
MANPKHLAILEKGVEAWNRWKRKNPDVVPDLSGMDLHGAHLSGVDLKGANLNHAGLIAAFLSQANLSGANLSYSLLTAADLSSSYLTAANVSGAHLMNTELTAAHLTGTDLNGADLSGAHLHGADLEGADFSNATLAHTVLAYLDLSKVSGLDSVKHNSPSSIGIDTLYRSGGKIPETFLRGCGVSDEFITYARSLVERAIEFYSCFISYSNINHDFAEHLYADLQNKGVRCWFAPEDLKIGDKFRQRIDESIRLHDKLLLILSEDSISSPWVEEEVESALERERRENSSALFPIRIDDAVMASNQAWAASLRRMRHIGDFTHWKDPESYQKAFGRLLRDLKAKGQR